ncbi:MAG: hypothetical protein H7Y60_00615 [Rhodospirillaceae bacterium]|nr:hypothetical protein [Rhodospirillales bacterium]
MRTFLIIAAIAGAVTGCADSDSVLFVTKSSIGIDFDSQPPGASIAYDRVEGFFGPRYDNGAVPPVVASIATGGSLFDPEVRQVYATGKAAEIVQDGAQPGQSLPLAGGRKMMFFGTSTTAGLKIGFTTGYPDSFSFGYKRKEASYIPLGTTKDASGNQVDAYPSVLASLDTRVQSKDVQSTSMLTRQYFATGSAAEMLATKKEVKKAFHEKHQDAFEVYADTVAAQQDEALGALKCVAGLTDSDLPKVMKNARDLGLLGDDEATELGPLWQQGANPSTEELRSGRSLYASNVGVSDGKSSSRATALQSHRAFACGLVSAYNRR